MSRLRLRAPLALPCLIAMALPCVPDRAEACSPDPCNWSSRFRAVQRVTAFPTSAGAVAFSAGRGPGGALEAADLANIELTATSGGSPVAGTLAVIPNYPGFLWRADAPLTEGAELEFSIRIDNASIDFDGCGPDELLYDATATVSSTPAALALAEVSTETELVIEPDLAIDNLACCDGAYPSSENVCGEFVDVSWREGHCAAKTGVGKIYATFELTPPEPAPGDGEVVTRLVIDDIPSDFRHQPIEFHVRRDREFCAVLETLRLSTGESLRSDKMCFGDVYPGDIGPQDIDVARELSAVCDGEPYVCSTVEVDVGFETTQWNSDDCDPFLPGGADDAGGEDHGESEGDGDGGVESGGEGDSGVDGGEGDSGVDDGDAGADAGGGRGGEGAGEDTGAGQAEDGGTTTRGCQAAGFGAAPAWVLGAALFRRRRRGRV